MKRFGLSIMTVPRSQESNRQTAWVNLHVHEEGEKPRVIPLVEYAYLDVPDAAAGSGFEWAVEVADMVYQALTQAYAANVKSQNSGEVNSRPADTSTN